MLAKISFPLLRLFVRKSKRAHYRTKVGKEVDPIMTGNNLRDVDKKMALFTSIIERHIREHPERYPWFHKRWKTKNHCPLPQGYLRQRVHGFHWFTAR